MGLIYIIAAESCWAMELVFIRKFFPDKSPFFITAITIVLGAVVYSPGLFFFREKLTGKDWVVLIVLALVSWVLAQTLYVYGIQKSPSSFSSSIATLALPFFSIILGAILLKEGITPKAIVGGVFMVVGFLFLSL